LESISKEHEIDVVRQAKQLTNFIYNHHQILSLMRVHTKKKDIVRPRAIRFAMTFLTLESILQKKAQLCHFFLSDEYAALIQPRRRKKFADKARKMQDVIFNNF
jgi:hypothetical protein